MKTTLLCSLLFMTSFSLLAKEELVKSCSTVISMPGEPQKIESQFKIIKKNGAYIAKIAQKSGDQIAHSEDEVTVQEFKVKSGLKADLSNDDDVEKLNEAEKIITHALSVTGDPEMKGVFSAGIDLSKVRSAKIYTVGKTTRFGSASIVEAKDEAGKIIGTFLGGFLVSPCSDLPDFKEIKDPLLKQNADTITNVKINDKSRGSKPKVDDSKGTGPAVDSKNATK